LTARSTDGRLIGYVDLEGLSTCVAYLRERLGGARGPGDRPAVAEQALDNSESEIPRADNQGGRHQISLPSALRGARESMAPYDRVVDP
jgi:hypothetical protein